MRVVHLPQLLITKIKSRKKKLKHIKVKTFNLPAWGGTYMNTRQHSHLNSHLIIMCKKIIHANSNLNEIKKIWKHTYGQQQQRFIYGVINMKW